MATKHKLQPDADDGPPDGGTERLCAVTRVHLPPEALIRFVAAPDGTIVPDLERRLPGRGVWITCDRKALEKAVASRAFARSLKAAVTAPADLADRVDALLERRAQDTLSLANKAGLIVAGFQQVDAALDKTQVAVVVHGSDAAADGAGKLDRKFRAISRDLERPAPIVTSLTMAQLSLAMGRPSVVHAALIPGGLTQRFLREAERLARYRSASAVSDQDVDISADLTEG